jgi:spore maturation protein CgeB
MKHYRIVRIVGLHYDHPMRELYTRHPGLASSSYYEQQKTLFDMAYVYGDSFSRGMMSLGHEAYEIVYDLRILQETWAKDKGVRYNPKHWQHEIILAQIKDIRPDIIYFQDIHSLPYDIRKELKMRFPFVKLIVVYKGYPGAFNELGNVDILFAGIPRMVEQFSAVGLKPYLVYHAFDETILKSLKDNLIDKDLHKYDFTFIGSSGFDFGYGHQTRFWSLVELIKKTDIKLWIEEDNGENRLSDYLKRLRYWIAIHLIGKLKNLDAEKLSKLHSLRILPEKVKMLVSAAIDEKIKAKGQKGRLPEKPIRKLYPKRCLPPIYGIDMYQVLRQSRVTFNKHTDAAIDNVGNIRMFQATGVGTCLLTDTGTNMRDLFEEDSEVVTYRTIDECIEKVKYLLEHDDVRQQIAVAGQRRTLKDHTMVNRCRQIDEIIQKRL